MLISVGIPTYNRSGLMRRAIESVLRQTHTDFEILVSDDCSPDDTEQVVRGFGDPRIRYLNSGVRAGVPRNWNACARAASGEYFSLLPDDDEYAPEFLERMAACLSQDPGIAFAQCGMTDIDESSRVTGTRTGSKVPLAMRGAEALKWQFSTLLCNPVALMFRRSRMAEAGFWREDYWDDWAFILKLAFRHGFRFLPEPLACNRSHHQNLSRQLARERRDGILDLINQTSDVFGGSLPASRELIRLRAFLERRISRMGIRAAFKDCLRGDFPSAGMQLARAHDLYALALVDPMQLVDIGSAVRDRLRARAQKRGAERGS